jgi:two pore calcium channel protein 1
MDQTNALICSYPDVMMKSYNHSRWASIFFISYLSINLYFLMNLMLAVVYDAFTRIEREKFRRLFLHKRKAAQHAFKLLVTREMPDAINFQHFEGLLKHYKGNRCERFQLVLELQTALAETYFQR